MQTATLSTDEEALLDNLEPGFTAYRCTRCGHLVGDPKDKDEWTGRCPPVEMGGCHETTVFTKVN